MNGRLHSCRRALLVVALAGVLISAFTLVPGASPLGAGGKVSLANAAGATHVIADVAGWFG